jgi:hypothetical protein
MLTAICLHSSGSNLLPKDKLIELGIAKEGATVAWPALTLSMVAGACCSPEEWHMCISPRFPGVVLSQMGMFKHCLQSSQAQGCSTHLCGGV